MKNILVWGSGEGFKKRKEEIIKKYNILAIIVNSEKEESNNSEFKHIKPSEISQYSYDFIFICSIKYELSIKYQLIRLYGVNREKLKSINEILRPDYDDESLNDMIYQSCDEYIKLNQRKEFNINEQEMWLIKEDFESEAGLTLKHYFAQDIWGAKKILMNRPEMHYDIGSRIDGFISHLLVFLDSVNYIDIRPLPNEIDNLNFIQGDATNLENIIDNSIESISSFHAIEHFGLGRYGDKLDPEACFKAMKAFERVLAIGGFLYIGVPIGPKNKVIFNAHRIFRPQTIIESFKNLKLIEFAIVRGESPNYEVIDLEDIDKTSNNIEDYSCGLFMFKKVN